MIVTQLLDRCRSLGVELIAAGDRLRYRGRPAVLTPDLLAALKACKSGVLAALREPVADLPDASPARLLVGDNLDLLRRVRTGSVNLVPCDPPFNIGLDYPGYDDRRPDADYLGGLRVRFAECKRVLAEDGSLFVAIGPRHQHRVLALLEDLGFFWRNTIIWHYTFGPHQTRKLTPSYTPIHYVTKHPTRFTFEADAVR